MNNTLVIVLLVVFLALVVVLLFVVARRCGKKDQRKPKRCVYGFCSDNSSFSLSSSVIVYTFLAAI